jgi:C1A family cysteine protease
MVSSQGQCLSRWAFGSIASVASTTLMGSCGTYEFSENHMNVRHGFDWLPCAGGNADIAGA